MTTLEKIHRSKRDAWLVAVLAAAGMLSLGISVMALFEEPAAGLMTLAVLLVAGGFVVWTFTRTFYVLTATDLLIRSGPFRWSIPLAHVRQVLPTRNPLSSPALSLDRLAIRHASGTIMISPVDQRRFLEDLVERTPGLVFDGTRAIRP